LAQDVFIAVTIWQQWASKSYAVFLGHTNELLNHIIQPHQLAIVAMQHFSLFGHTARMPDETNAKKIWTAALLKNWRRRPHTMWMKTI